MTYFPGRTYQYSSVTTAHAFDQFRQNEVDLKPDRVKKARRSRDYLEEQLVELKNDESDFPPITGEFKPFGSFARRTKVRPLDDVDMLVMLNGKDSQYLQAPWNIYTFRVRITDELAPLRTYSDENGWVNSTKILNHFKRGLNRVPNYKKSEIKRSGVAVVLNLKSYEWAFDIVPAIPAGDGSGTTLYYLIPDGEGNWKRTDPRFDQDFVTSANQSQNGHLLPLIRLIKYWNVKSFSAPRLMSYHLETLLINAYNSGHPTIESRLRFSVPEAFRQLAADVIFTCPDPKGLGPHLDEGMSWETKEKVRDAANTRYEYATNALYFEQQGDHQEAIKWWGYVFPNFE